MRRPAACTICGEQFGQLYGYRDVGGVLRWFCSDHRLRTFAADARSIEDRCRVCGSLATEGAFCDRHQQFPDTDDAQEAAR